MIQNGHGNDPDQAVVRVGGTRGMSSGGYTKQAAMKFQTFTGRLKREAADQYDGKTAPTCLPLCEVCLLKWLETSEQEA